MLCIFAGFICDLNSFSLVSKCLCHTSYKTQCISYNVKMPKGPFTNTCKWGLVQMRAHKIFDPCKGVLKKKTTEIKLKIEFTCFSMGLTHNFHGKKGALIFFFLVWREGLEKCSRYFIYIRPPYKCLWTVPNSPAYQDAFYLSQFSPLRNHLNRWHFYCYMPLSLLVLK